MTSLTKEEFKRKLRHARENKCEHVCSDGAGHYCKLIQKPNKNYPHEYWRVMCFGHQYNAFCEAKKRGLLEKEEKFQS